MSKYVTIILLVVAVSSITCNSSSAALSNGTCRNCSTIYKYCSSCNQTQCFHCSTNYGVNISNYQECVPCNSMLNCSKCTDSSVCVTCDDGYYVKGGNCRMCIFPCTNCSSGTVCNICDTATQLYLLNGTQCVLCNETTWAPNCSKCSLQTYANGTSYYPCYACNQGFYLSSTTCISCVAPCLVCSSASVCSKCDAKNILVKASSSCMSCGNFIVNCDTCLNQLICLKCVNGYFLSAISACFTCTQITANCSLCTQTTCLGCIAGYSFEPLTSTCRLLPCMPPCQACVANLPSQCLSCISGYYLNINTCQQCPTGCSQCSDSITCTECNANYQISTTSCVLCASNQYYSPFTKTCYACPTYCLTCDFNNCLSCYELFGLKYVDNIWSCVDICGDGYAIDNPCDVGFNALATGCSNDCQIQTDFSCPATPITYTAMNGSTITVKQTTCSYTGLVTVGLWGCQQSIFANAMKLKFLISPYLIGMPLPSDSLSYLTQIFILTGSIPITIENINIDTSMGTVQFYFSFAQSLVSSNFSLLINYDYLSSQSVMFQNLHNYTYAFPLNESKFFGQYFTESQLMQTKIIFKVTMALSLVGLVLFFIGLFSKELAGIEQMILFQTIFILLVFDEKASTLSRAALGGFKYSLVLWFVNFQNEFLNCSQFMKNRELLNFTRSFVLNFSLFILPIVSMIFLLYRLKHKHFPIKQERGRILQEYFRGECLLSVSIYNFIGTFVFSKIALQNFNQIEFLDWIIFLTSTSFIIYSIIIYHKHPQMMGNFRAAFRVSGDKKDQDESNSKTSCIKKIVRRKFFTGTLGEFYAKHSTNFYYLFIFYLVTSSLVIILQASVRSIVLVTLQSVILLILIFAKPYFTTLEIVRSVLTFTLLILANWIGEDWIVVWLVTAGCCLHALLCLIIVVSSFIDRIKSLFNDRSKLVRKMFKEQEQLKATQNTEKQKIQKQALTQIIQRYNELQRQKPLDTSIPEQQELKQDVIIEEEGDHLRFKKSFAFFDKHGKEIQNELIEQHYDDI